MRFESKVAIVTGAASGIGFATAERLAAEGAAVAIADFNVDAAQQAAAKLRSHCPHTMHVRCDVSKESDVIAAIERTKKQFGRLDIIVNNAGIMIFKPLAEHSEQDLWKVMEVDFLGAFFFIKHAFLQCADGAAIVNVSSIHAVETTPLVTAYAAAKAALLSLTRSAAIEGKAKGFRVNAILSGAVETPMLRENPNIRSGAEQLDPNNIGQPGDIADAIAFLVSDEAKFVQGAALRVDGGRLSRL